MIRVIKIKLPEINDNTVKIYNDNIFVAKLVRLNTGMYSLAYSVKLNSEITKSVFTTENGMNFKSDALKNLLNKRNNF